MKKIRNVLLALVLTFSIFGLFSSAIFAETTVQAKDTSSVVSLDEIMWARAPGTSSDDYVIHSGEYLNVDVRVSNPTHVYYTVGYTISCYDGNWTTIISGKRGLSESGTIGFIVPNGAKKIKAEFKMKNDNPKLKIIDGYRCETISVNNSINNVVRLGNIGSSYKGYNYAYAKAGGNYNCHVHTWNNSQSTFDIKYKISSFTGETWETIKEGTLRQSGKKSEEITTPDVKIPMNSRAIKTLWIIQENKNISIFEGMRSAFDMVGGGNQPPWVTRADPGDGDSNYNEKDPITVKFSDKIKLNSDGQAIKINSQEIDVSKLKVLDRELYIDYQLSARTSYIVVVPAGIVTDMKGKINEGYTFRFKTGKFVADNNIGSSTPFEIIESMPADGAIGISTKPVITVKFSKAYLSANDDFKVPSITIKDSAGKDFYKQTSYSTENKLIIYTKSLEPNTNYILTIAAGAYKDKSWNLNKQFTTSFTTGDSTITPDSLKVVKTTPYNGQVQVNKGTLVSFTFSDKIYESNLFNIEIIDSNGIPVDSGSAHTAKDSEMILSYFKLLPNKGYTVNIKEGTVYNAKGAPNEPYSFKFKTSSSFNAADYPIITKIFPAHYSKNVNLNPIFLIKFSEPICASGDISNLDKTCDIMLRENGGGDWIRIKAECPKSVSERKDTIVIIPQKKLKPNTEYKLSVLNGSFMNVKKKINTNYDFIFTTGSESNISSAKKLKDVPAGHWAIWAITELTQKGAISGFPNATFKPNEKVNREQFAKMMVSALKLPIVEPQAPSFIDVQKSYWAYKYIESVKKYFPGYDKGNGIYFKGKKEAIREEIACALVKAKGYENKEVDIGKLSSIFKDYKKISKGYEKYVLIAYENKLISGYKDKTFRPQGTLTRAEAAQLLYNVLK